MNSSAQPTVMLFGVFHFSNPGLDLVKGNVVDVMSKESQEYLDSLSQDLTKFSPTHILLEYDQTNDAEINQRYLKYCSNTYKLAVEEVEQLGFRIAKNSGLRRIHSLDERNTPWDCQPMLEKLSREPDLQQRFNDAVSRFTHAESVAQTTLSLQSLLKRYNNPEFDKQNKAFYLMTNAVGVEENYAGANASASWWHRNFKMYARIQKHAKPGTRILAIAGQGHTAVLRDFVSFDPYFQAEDINKYL